MCLKFEYQSVDKAFILKLASKISGFFINPRFCKNNDGDFGGLYKGLL